MRPLARQLGRLSAALNSTALWGAILALLVMVFAASWQVVARYVFEAPPIWTEELARRAMVWTGMLGASCAFYAGTDPTLFPAMRLRRGGPGLALAVIRACGVLAFAIPILWYSVFDSRMNAVRGFLGRSLARQAEMLDVSMVWFTAAVPLAFLLILIHLIARLALRVSGQMPGIATPNS